MENFKKAKSDVTKIKKKKIQHKLYDVEILLVLQSSLKHES